MFTASRRFVFTRLAAAVKDSIPGAACESLSSAMPTTVPYSITKKTPDEGVPMPMLDVWAAGQRARLDGSQPPPPQLSNPGPKQHASGRLCGANTHVARFGLNELVPDADVQVIANGGMECIQATAMEKVLEMGLQDNFYIMDVARLHNLHHAFVSKMPRVHPFYAVKCNPNAVIMRNLAALGCGFDCASAQEIAQVLRMGVGPDRIIFASPCKRPSDLAFAVQQHVKRMTFDCEDELRKIAAACPSADLVLRIRADDPSAVVQFGHKFGANPRDEAPALLAQAAACGMSVVGVSFHVGSGSLSAAAYHAAIAASREVFDAGRRMGFDMHLLDIGGGFFGRFNPNGEVVLDAVARTINAALERYFPEDDSRLRIIAEPGRYFAESAATMFSLVHTVKHKSDTRGCVTHRSCYITDGVYGSFNAIVYDHSPVAAKVMRSPLLAPASAEQQSRLVPTTVFGPTCDGVDLIYKDVPMPALRSGDWLQFPNFGAYTLAGACAFNGMPVDAPSVFYVWGEKPVGAWEGRDIVVRKGDEFKDDRGDFGEHELTFVATLGDLESIC